jgi:hypothetical protein
MTMTVMFTHQEGSPLAGSDPDDACRYRCVRGKRPFSSVIYIRVTAFKANDRRPDKLLTRFFPDGRAFLVLYALNLGPHRCLQAGGGQSGLVCSECGFEAPYICRDCGLKTDVVCEPIAYCLQAVSATRGRIGQVSESQGNDSRLGEHQVPISGLSGHRE